VVCAAPKVEDWVIGITVSISDTAQSMDNNNPVHVVNHEACATCCATSGSVVGGISEAPDVAGATGTGASSMGGGTYAVLGAVGGVLAITVAGNRGGQEARGGQQ